MKLTTEDKVKIGITVVVVVGMLGLGYELYKGASALGSGIAAGGAQIKNGLEDLEAEGEAAVSTVTNPISSAWAKVKSYFSPSTTTSQDSE